jgi:hypothetical protein
MLEIAMPTKDEVMDWVYYIKNLYSHLSVPLESLKCILKTKNSVRK